VTGGEREIDVSPPASGDGWGGGDAGRRTGVFHGPHGVRWGWKLAIYVPLLFVLILVVGPPLVAVGVDATTAYFIAMLAAALLAGWFMLRVVDGRPAGALGFQWDRAAVRESALGFAGGTAMLGAAAAALAVAGSTRWVADTGSIPEYAAALARAFAFFAVAAAAEEALFRGYLFQALTEGVGPWPAAVLASAAFALMHAGNPNATAFGLLNIFAAGVMLSAAYLRTRSLWFATGVHLGWNWTMSALLDLPVSGLQHDTPLYSAVERGADWWTGGPFGPEAGLAGTLAIAAGLAWIVRSRRLGETEAMRARRPLVDRHLGPAWPR
jgi:membrane protease YdiL (CAAX protease family)